MAFSVGLGLTNECNLACPHCYRDADFIKRLSLGDVQEIFRSVPVSSVNLGYAENGLHPEFIPIVEWLSEQTCKLTLTSNGHSVQVLPDHLLTQFIDVELSLDFATADQQDRWRGQGNFQDVMDSIRRCRSLGVDVTVLAVMMRHNLDQLVPIGRLAFAEGAKYRVNVYQAAKTDLYALTYEEYWHSFETLLSEFALVSTTEPALAAALGLPEFAGCGCGRSTVRVMPNKVVVPCTYWPEPDLRLEDLAAVGAKVTETVSFRAARRLPEACRGCAFELTCGGGCAGRRALSGTLDEPDHYCRIVRGDAWNLPVRQVNGRDMPKSRSACTTIFAP